jgi:hypothetical protein
MLDASLGCLDLPIHLLKRIGSTFDLQMLLWLAHLSYDLEKGVHVDNS